ncbi:transglutaminase-like domain-containing protein [uncultured Aquimarina sp.]|uniref:transglutaminase domain-containing protein n=1 Tax=uncultured Aquimarina sp. TaxID=575652 RepID=UPI00260EDE24|nr:transglutaminase-like domain-containing protein [uncultured Aquimarina sp.]
MYKPLIFFLLSLFSALNIYGQDFDKIEAIVHKYPTTFKTPKKLADQIAKDFKTELDQAKAIYSWITKNISYDYNESGKFYSDYANSYKSVSYNPFPSFRSSNYIEYDKTKSGSKKHLKTEKKYREKISKRVVSTGIAVCEGYTQLFKDVCDHLGITCFYVLGTAKNQIPHIGREYRVDHAWNIIEIDFKKYLIDATWGSTGYYNIQTQEFIEETNYDYFGMPAELFIKGHYPDFYENSLLPKTISKKEFLDAPLFYQHEKAKDFSLISPSTGILDVNTSQIVKFEITYNEAVNSIIYTINNRQFNYQGDIKPENGVIQFEVTISEPNPKELIVFINQIPMVGFKIAKDFN